MKKREIKAVSIWNKQKIKALGNFITLHAQKQTQEQVLENKRLTSQYRIEDYNDPDLIPHTE